MEKLFAKTESENSKVARRIVEILKSEGINLLLLKGQLGAGKTTLTRQITKLLNAQQLADSPTFVLQKIYKLNENESGFARVVHIDLYRLSSNTEIEELAISEEVEDKETLVIVEWPEKYNFEKYKNLTVEISEKDDGREFLLKPNPRIYQKAFLKKDIKASI